MRKIIHIDMDAFFAQVEQVHNPEYRGKPIAVGAIDDMYGIICAASYEARQFGVKSAMSNRDALRLCPQLKFVKMHMPLYAAVSKQLHEIYHEATDLVEGLSLDEAYLDVTENKLGLSSATEVALYLKRRIKEETGLTSSAGVSYNMMIAKIGSDYQKPDGLTVVPPKLGPQFVADLDLRAIPGVGKSAIKKFHNYALFYVRDLLEFSREDLNKYFGLIGDNLYDYARGNDYRAVRPNRARKSYSKEITLRNKYSTKEECLPLLFKLCKSVVHMLQRDHKYGKTLNLRIRFADFTTYTRAVSLPYNSNIEVQFSKHLKSLLDKFPNKPIEVRLIGLGISNLSDQKEIEKPKPQQISLF